MGCSCDLEDINEATFERYGFVAQVKILEAREIQGPDHPGNYLWLRQQRLLRMETLELYRGQPTDFAVEADHDSSCGTFMSTGEEWLVYAFVSRNGQLLIHSCTPTTDYRSAKGIKNLRYSYPGRLKKWLDDYCGIIPTNVSLTGPSSLSTYYPDGCLEQRTEYVDGRKSGPSVHYYPSGLVMDERRYYDDHPIELRKVYLPTGKLDFEVEYNFQGEVVRKTNHLPGYDGLRHEIIYVPEADLERNFAYRPNGTLESMHYYHEGWNLLEEKHYDERGILIHHVTYSTDNEPRMIIDSLRR